MKTVTKQILAVLLSVTVLVSYLLMPAEQTQTFAADSVLHSLNLWTSTGGHGSGSMTVWKNASTSVSAPQIIYAWFGDPADSYSLFCIDYGKAANTGNSYATQSDYDKLNEYQKDYIGYVLGCAQRVQAPRYNGSFNDYGGDVTFENWKLYNSTQLMIWYYIDKFYTPGTNEGIGWDGVVKTCEAGWGNLAECERIKGIVDNLFTTPSFTTADGSVAPPTYKLTYNAATGKYETILQDTNANCTIGKFSWSGSGLTFTRCNASGVADANGTYLKISSDTPIASSSAVVTSNQYVASTGNITYVKNTSAAQDLVLCNSSRPDPVRAYMNVYTESALQISKQDITTSAELPGATLQLTNSSGQVVDSWVSTTTPHVIHGLSTGSYTLTETIAPDGYAKTQSITFTYDADAGITQTVVMKDSLTRIELLKTDKDGNAVSGAKLELYNSAGQMIDSWISDTSAYVITGLPTGTYTLHEAKVPAGYAQAEDKKFTVTDAPQTVRIVMKDEEVQGRIRIFKTGDQVVSAQEYNSVYGSFKRLTFGQKPLENVVFEIHSRDGALVETVTTNEDGYAVSGTLPWGSYYIVEKETPAGLVNTGEKIPVELTCPEDYHKAIYTKEVNIKNAVGDTEINVYKQGEILNIEDGTYSFGTKPLEGVIFGVYANEDILDYRGNVVIAKDECIGFIKTGEDGKAALKDALVEGSYYYKEVQTLEGYILDDTKREFELTLGNEELNTMDVNKENPDVNQLYKTRLQLVKQDGANRFIKLSGVEFELYNADDELMGVYVTDEKGRILIDNLPYGSYYFKETKAADGYIIDTSKQMFEANAEEQTLEVVNTKTPKTGDNVMPLWLVLLLLVVTGGCGIYLLKHEPKKK